jgi:hypothetical protein
MSAKKQLIALVPVEIHRSVKARAAEEGITISRYIERLVSSDLTVFPSERIYKKGNIDASREGRSI